MFVPPSEILKQGGQSMSLANTEEGEDLGEEVNKT